MTLSGRQDWSERDGGGQPGRLHLLYRLALCGLGFVLLGVVVLGVGPNLPRIAHFQEQIDTLKESEIWAGAIFYTGVEQIPAMESSIESAVRSKSLSERASSVPGRTGG